MKIRSGFVSNSSSSSFIVAVNKVAECPHCKRSDSNFLDFVERIGDITDCECTRINARGADAVIEWWRNLGGDDELVDKIKSIEASGREVGAFCISYHDNITNDEWYKQRHTGAVEKIWSDH